MSITTTQIQKTNVKARRSGFYIVKADGKKIGSFEHLWYASKRTYAVRAGHANSTIYSTKQAAIDNVISRHQA